MQSEELHSSDQKPVDLIDYTRRIYYLLLFLFLIVAVGNAVDFIRWAIAEDKISQAETARQKEIDYHNSMCDVMRSALKKNDTAEEESAYRSLHCD